MSIGSRRGFSKAILLPSGGLAVVVACWSLRDAVSSQSRKAAGPSRTLPPAADTERVRAALERAEMRLAAAERRIVDLERDKLVRAAAPREAPSDDVPSSEQQPPAANADMTETERRARVDAAFASESVDPSWRPEAEVRATLHDLLPAGVSLRSVDCRRSLCRVETSHPNAESQRAYVQAVALPSPTQGIRPFDGALFDEGTPSPDGRDFRSVTYLMRPGFEPP